MVTMTYDSLTAPKGTVGSLLNWIGYGKVDVITVLDEAQFLLYSMLRVREMRTEWVFGMSVGQASVALPSRFLDPIGKIYDVTNSTNYDQRIQSDVLESRNYDNSITGTFGTNPFTTVAASALVTCAQTAHGLNQDSTITISGAPALNGLTLTGTFPITSIIDANTFVIDTGNASDTVASASGSGGGVGVTYTANNLVAASPTRWGVWNETVKFDTAFNVAAALKLLFYRRPLLLSTTNETNFLTTRYPKLLRVACNASAADFMHDNEEYQKHVGTLSALVPSVAAENDLIYSGATIGTDTP